jgi:predicted phosphodiesterase
MKRTKPFKKADAILTSDWHLRDDTPVCRIDEDFIATLFEKVAFVSSLQKKHDCPVLHGGDLFHKWNISAYLIAKTIESLPDNFYSVYGNHDLPLDNIELKNKCGMYAVAAGKGLQALDFGYWKDKPTPAAGLKIKGRKVLIMHEFVYRKKDHWNEDKGAHAQKLLRVYKDYDLILTGDNHTPFVDDYKERLLVNPGSLSRQSAAQIDFKPRVYLWYAETNTVVPVYIPIKEGVVSREHVEKEEKRDGRIDAFVSSLDTEWEGNINFKVNLRMFEKSNEIEQDVMLIVYRSID